MEELFDVSLSDNCFQPGRSVCHVRVTRKLIMRLAVVWGATY